MTAEERYEKFKKEYEALCDKYQMYHTTYDKWDTGDEEIVVFDEKEEQFWIE